MTLEDEGVAGFRIDEAMFALEPLRLIFHLVKNEKRRHRRQSFCRIEHRNMRALSGDIKVGEEFSSSSLGHEARGKRRSTRTVDRDQLNLWIGFLKLADGKARIVDNVNRDFTLRFRRFQRLLPLTLPRRLGLGGVRRN